MWIDSHAHLGCDSLYLNIDQVLERAKHAGIHAIINICTDKATSENGQLLSHKYPWIYNVGSTTPHDTLSEGEENFSFFEQLAKEKKLVAIGETGLDYHYEYSPKSIQQKFFSRYLALAVACDLPVVIHCRDAFDDLFSMTDGEYQAKPLLLHCFTGTKEDAKRALDRGWKISFSGIITFKKSESLREVVRYVPLDALVLETDSPYLAPQSKRGIQNEPAFIIETAHMVAEIKQVSLQQLATVTSHTVETFFRLSC